MIVYWVIRWEVIFEFWTFLFGYIIICSHLTVEQKKMIVPVQYLKGLWGNTRAMPETGLNEDQIIKNDLLLLKHSFLLVAPTTLRISH